MNAPLRILLAVALLGTSTLAVAHGFSWTSGGAGDATTIPTTGAASLLPAAQAFKLQQPAWDGQRIELKWTIAPGYYLYRDRIHVSPVTSGAPAGRLALPPAQAHEEAGIGEVHIYRNTLQALYTPPGTTALHQLQVTVQGCADQGVCYPPLTRTVSVPVTPQHAR